MTDPAATKPDGRETGICADTAVSLADAAATEAAGAALAAVLAPLPGAVVFLRGDLGAGKTTLARGLLRALGVTGPVRSPTYTLVEPYLLEARSVVHMDLYRLADPEEWWTLGLDSYAPDRALWLVEWPERAGGLLPVPALDLRLETAGDARLLDIAGDRALAAQLRRRLKVEH